MVHFAHFVLIDDTFCAGFVELAVDRPRHAAGLLDDVGIVQIRRFDQYALDRNVLAVLPTPCKTSSNSVGSDGTAIDNMHGLITAQNFNFK
jgi:hypothetical protein